MDATTARGLIASVAVWDGKKTLFDMNFLALGIEADEASSLARTRSRVLKVGKERRCYDAQQGKKVRRGRRPSAMKNAEMATITKIRTWRDMRRPYRQAASRRFRRRRHRRSAIAGVAEFTRSRRCRTAGFVPPHRMRHGSSPSPRASELAVILAPRQGAGQQAPSQRARLIDEPRHLRRILNGLNRGEVARIIADPCATAWVAARSRRRRLESGETGIGLGGKAARRGQQKAGLNRPSAAKGPARPAA
jgi:hypothetical protein